MASSGYEVRVIDNEKGKGLFARQAYLEDAVIFEERPVISCQFSWNSEYGYLTCDHCLRPLETAEENVRRLTSDPTLILPHTECCETRKETIAECLECGTQYCTVECRNEAYQAYHSTLCLRTRERPESHPLLRLNDTWKQMHYPPETATIMLLVRMVALVNQAEDKAQVLSTFSQFCQRTVNDVHEIAHNLLGEKFIGQIDVLREMMLSALNTEHTSHWLTPEGFRSLLALVGTNGQGIGTSPFSRWVQNVSRMKLPTSERISVDKLIDRIYENMEGVVGSFLNNEGSGLYVLQSAANHSCLPNAVVEFPHSDNTLVLKALRVIQPNEEICISYLDECELERSRHSRQKALSLLYLFVCRCDKCLSQADEEDVTSEEEDQMDDDMFSEED